MRTSAITNDGNSIQIAPFTFQLITEANRFEIALYCEIKGNIV